MIVSSTGDELAVSANGYGADAADMTPKCSADLPDFEIPHLNGRVERAGADQMPAVRTKDQNIDQTLGGLQGLYGAAIGDLPETNQIVIGPDGQYLVVRAKSNGLHMAKIICERRTGQIGAGKIDPFCADTSQIRLPYADPGEIKASDIDVEVQQ